MAHAIKTLSLYELDDELRQIEEALMESGGEITEEMEEKWGELLEMKADKVEGYIRMIRKFEASSAGIKEERERLQRAEKAMANAAKALKERLCWSMEQRGDTEHQTAIGKVKLQRSGSKPVILKGSIDELPERYQKVEISANLAGLKADLKSADDEKRAQVEEWAEFGEAKAFIRIY